MVPRTEMATLLADQSIKEAIETVINERYTRYPVIKDDKDHIIGIVNSKDLFKSYFLDETIPLTDLMRPVIRVIENIPIQELLIRMQKERIHMAILVDEYGGTAGLVTVEDILEEIVGEIRDEFDQDEMPHIIKKRRTPLYYGRKGFNRRSE